MNECATFSAPADQHPRCWLTALVVSTFVLTTFVNVATTSARADDRSLASFGVVGDGIHDDTAALQAAIDAGIGVARFSTGSYRLTATVVIDLDKVGVTALKGDGTAKIVMHSAGPAFRIIGTHYKSADPPGFENKVWERQRMPMIDGLAFHGSHDEAEGIVATGTMQLTITRSHFRMLKHGVRLIENNRNVHIADCHFYENRGIGIYYDQVNLHQSNIVGCHISYNKEGGIVTRGGNVRNIHITGCDIESNMAPDTAATANVLIDCTGSAYGTGEVAITGCTIQHNNPSPDSANIRILGGSNKAANGSAVREGNVTITGNVLSDVQVNVHLRECRGVTLAGNTFWQGYKHNMLVEGCSSVVMSGNNFDRNPRYDYGNTKDANNSLVFRNCEDCNLNGLHVTNVWRDVAGILLDKCRRIQLTNCTILDCDNVGLILNEVQHSRVAGCMIRDDRAESKSDSMLVVGGAMNVLVDNILHEPAVIADGSTTIANNHVVPRSTNGVAK